MNTKWKGNTNIILQNSWSSPRPYLVRPVRKAKTIPRTNANKSERSPSQYRKYLEARLQSYSPSTNLFNHLHMHSLDKCIWQVYMSKYKCKTVKAKWTYLQLYCPVELSSQNLLHMSLRKCHRSGTWHACSCRNQRSIRGWNSSNHFRWLYRISSVKATINDVGNLAYLQQEVLFYTISYDWFLTKEIRNAYTTLTEVLVWEESF